MRCVLGFLCLLVGLCSWDFHGLLSLGGERECVCLCFVYKSVYAYLNWGRLGTLCLLILTEWLISANWEGQFKQAQKSGCHTSVTWVQRGRQYRVLFSASALPFPKLSPPCISSSLDPPPSCLWPPAWPRRVATEWALCLDTAISSQRTSEMWAGQGSGQRRRQKHGCLRHLGSQQLTEGPTQRGSCWSMGSVICIEYGPRSLRLCTSWRARARGKSSMHSHTHTQHNSHKHAWYASEEVTLTHKCARLHTDVSVLHQCLH